MNPIVVTIYQPVDYGQRLVADYLAALAAAHRRGEHPYGSMRRDCPLCNR